MSAETWMAVIAGATFLVFWTGSILGLGVYITNQFGKLRSDFDAKHRENGERYDKINALVIRHETILNRPRGRG